MMRIERGDDDLADITLRNGIAGSGLHDLAEARVVTGRERRFHNDDPHLPLEEQHRAECRPARCPTLLHERRAKAQLRLGRPPHTLLVLLEEAMRSYEEAEKIRPTGNDEAILRWNRCVRLIHARAESDWHREVEIEMGDSTS